MVIVVVVLRFRVIVYSVSDDTSRATQINMLQRTTHQLQTASLRLKEADTRDVPRKECLSTLGPLGSTEMEGESRNDKRDRQDTAVTHGK